jgi:nucleoid-associated protein YgaU
MEYIIQKGDTLGGIAQKFTGSAYNYKDLQELNGIKNANLILPGKKIQIPDKFSYPLKKADIPTEN